MRYLLDTGLLLGFTRKAPWALKVREAHDLGNAENMVFTSVICRGEILALAEKNGWGSERRARLETMLRQIPQLDISRGQVIEAYARLDAWTHGNSVVAPKNTQPPKPAVSMTQNDIWIAATAHASGATLLSTDRDFRHLHNVWLQFAYVRPG